ncbi:cytochrome P450 [Trametes coccinea BRFM310]|uniref:Cytochrome P450 n=1 Tax=Trametes coccinea (strain BRFM310) TaxID=1353009 RepID=A0A1Y2IZA5_TRAC3|nr:cytochrome P450 [Trametes coccinea BRFM310]
MDSTPVQLLHAILVCSTTWILWKIFRSWLVKSSLDNIPGPPPKSLIYGNLPQMITLNSGPFHDHLVENYSGIARLRGFFGAKILYVFEPTALHQIFVKDQHIYEEGRFFIKSNDLVVGRGLFSTLGEHHRKQRKMLNPVFSPKHMRNMVPIFYDVANLLVQAIETRVRDGPQEVDMISWMSRASLELVGRAGLGYSFDPLVRDEADEYASALKMWSNAMGRTTLPRRLLPYLPRLSFAGIGHAILKHFPHEGVRDLVRVSDTLWERSAEIYREKKRALEAGDAAASQQVGEGNDIMSILLKANMEASGEDKLDEEELIGQMSTMILAAMDTTSNALGMILDCLASHTDVQAQVREEVIKAGADKELDFDTLMGLPLLEAVCRETLRVYSPVTQVFRETRQDAVLPLAKPIRGLDGTLIHEVFLPKGTSVCAGLLNCNRNKALWGEDAYEWKPERWLSPLPDAVLDAKIPGVYSNLMTFLGGGRACIGFKFSQLEMKVLLSLLLANFTFEPTDQPIIWNLGGIRYPSLANDRKKISLPMKVGIYTRGA